MKKRLISILLCAAMAVTALSACAEKEAENPNDSPSIDKLDVSQYIENFPEYKGISLTKTVTPVTETGIDLEVTYALNQNPIEVKEEGAKVEEGDTANIDYVGTLNGEAFDGGSAEGTDLVIGSGQFIDGFEDGLVGKTKGETVELNLTFPENYGNEELNGQDVVFTVTINAIKRPLTEATDEWVAETTDYKTVAEYRESIRKELEDYYEEQAQTQLVSDAWNLLLTQVDVKEYPEELTAYGEESLEKQVQGYADSANQTIEEYVQAQDMSVEEYEDYKKEYGQNMAKQMLLLKGIIDGEGFTTEDEEYQSALQEYLDQYSVEEKELYDQYGKNTVYQTIMMKRVQQLLVDEAKIEEVIADEAASEDTPDLETVEEAENAEQPEEAEPTEAAE